MSGDLECIQVILLDSSDGLVESANRIIRAFDCVILCEPQWFVVGSDDVRVISGVLM